MFAECSYHIKRLLNIVGHNCWHVLYSNYRSEQIVTRVCCACADTDLFIAILSHKCPPDDRSIPHLKETISDILYLSICAWIKTVSSADKVSFVFVCTLFVLAIVAQPWTRNKTEVLLISCRKANGWYTSNYAKLGSNSSIKRNVPRALGMNFKRVW